MRLARQVVSERGLLPLELVSSVTGENVDEALNRLVIAIQCRRMQQQREQQQQATGARVRRRGRGAATNARRVAKKAQEPSRLNLWPDKHVGSASSGEDDEGEEDNDDDDDDEEEEDANNSSKRSVQGKRHDGTSGSKRRATTRNKKKKKNAHRTLRLRVLESLFLWRSRSRRSLDAQRAKEQSHLNGFVAVSQPNPWRRKQI